MKNLYLSSILVLSSLLAIGQFNWKTKASFPGAARHHPITFALDGNGYVLAGVTTTMVKDFYRYDPLSDSWTKMADFPGPARGFAYAVTNNATLADKYMTRADERLREARFIDATENSLGTIESSEFTDARL